ncbi:MAG: DUF11 domain-containing protein, partial [Thermoanaerobaculum sp.]|nr:DUF11 domain-containing protein [Thermoanaerobaculum sp.]
MTLNGTVQGGQQLQNTATLFHYANTEGGPNFVPAGVTDTAMVQVRYDGLGKTFTTEIVNAVNTATQAVIGELVTYTLTVTFHEGQSPNVTLQDTLPSGMAFVGCVGITASAGLSTDLAGGFAAACNPPTNPTVGPGGQNLNFTLGNITNSDTNNSVAETLQISFTAVVLNVLANQSGVNLVNTATLLINGGAGGQANVTSAPVTVIEPTVNSAKSASPTTGDAGDTITFTITLSNPAAGSTTAFDVNWTDTVPSTMTYVPGSLTQTACTAAVPPTLSDAGAPTLTGTGGRFEPNQSCTFTFQAVLSGSVAPGQSIQNVVQTQWTSLAGVVNDRSAYNADSDERTGADGLLGSGVLNDYRTQGTATVTVTNVSPTKSIAATSEPSTGPQAGTQRLVVGEIVRYRLQVRWPEGTSLNARLRDNLPAGLQFLNDNTARAAFVCNSGPTCMQSSDAAIGSNPVVAGNETTVGSITPTFVLPDAAVSASDTTNNDTYGDGTDPFFKFLNLTNTDSDADQEFVVVEFNAVVRNVTGNQAGTTRGNNFSVLVGTNPAINSNTVNLQVAEPSLASTKTVSTAPQDAGDPIAFTVVITNNSTGDNRATAFDLVLTDTFDSQITGLTVTSVGTTQGAICVGPSGAGTTAFSHNGGSFVGNTLTFTATCLDPAQSITLVVSGTVASAVPAGYTIGNSVLTTYTSLPGTNGTGPNPTGSTTPGAPGTATGERTGQDGVGGALNDYAVQATVQAPLAAPAINKVSASPSAAPVGGTVVFPLIVTLPEGVTQNLVVNDLVPVGLVYVSHTIVTTAAGSNGLLPADYNGTLPVPTVSSGSGSGDDVSWTFGNVTTNADNNPNTNSFVIFLTLRVNNELGNQNGTVLTNFANLTYTDPDTGTTTVADPTGEPVTVLEPELSLSKSLNNPAP